jgi:hypothetical protein
MLICKNHRRPFLRIPQPILINTEKSFTITKDFLFEQSAIYKFDDEDQHDVNKLFGFSIGHHHKNSYRFGWRPSADLTKIEIVGYEYRNGIRVPTIPICEIDPFRWYSFSMHYDPEYGELDYIVCDQSGLRECSGVSSKFEFKNHFLLGYTLGLYFGGNKKAPHDITINQRVVD